MPKKSSMQNAIPVRAVLNLLLKENMCNVLCYRICVKFHLDTTSCKPIHHACNKIAFHAAVPNLCDTLSYSVRICMGFTVRRFYGQEGHPFKRRYSKTCVKQPLKNRQNKDLNDKW